MRQLVLSDVHANAAALEAVLETERWDEVVFLGDVVNYGPEPGRAVDLLADLEGIFLEGNHDRTIRHTDPDGSVETQRDVWVRWTRRQLSDDQLAVLDGLSDPRTLEADGRRIQLHHGDFPTEGVPAFSGRLWPDAAPETFRAIAEQFDAPTILHGHTHVQFELEFEGTTFANAGSVGQPRLGDPRAAYAVLEDGTLTYEATAYDVDQTCEAMDELPLDDAFADAWKEAFRTGTLPANADIRNFEPLRNYEGVFR